ncbi:hypothetical protein [Flavobacterium sp. UMI-01]|uniref:hypothetical protein n=1 Tax=Flavobacterium sp. UMI-01 TaxID=1441053 RepID=UPI001C7D4F47|nr:hypothetical protein [Flavobacterium sp. UMI-01]GIZ09135.1 hypothetical protein FUMI01_18620 [Flavobacterium sp. UMI-01]
MKLEIDCPECGYNAYLVKETKTGKHLNVVVSKCNNGGCDLSIENIEHEHYEDFKELTSYFNNRYVILEIKDENCVN